MQCAAQSPVAPRRPWSGRAVQAAAGAGPPARPRHGGGRPDTPLRRQQQQNALQGRCRAARGGSGGGSGDSEVAQQTVVPSLDAQRPASPASVLKTSRLRREVRRMLPNGELGSRLGVMLLLVCIARAGYFIPLPGIDWHTAAGNSTLTLLMGSTPVACNVFMLGIAPLMSAYFFLGMLNIVPAIRKHFLELREQGQRGQDTYNLYVTTLFVAAAFWEAFSVARGWLASLAGQAVGVAAGAPAGMLAAAAAHISALAAAAASGIKSAGWTLSVVLLLTTGAAICKYLTQLVDQRGLGDGVGVLIALGVAVNYISFVQSSMGSVMAASPPAAALLLVGAMCAALTAASLWMQSVELRLPITFYRARQVPERVHHPLQQLLGAEVQQRGLRPGPKAPLLGMPVAAQDGKQQYFPMRLSPSGARSLLFANFWAALLQRPFSWLGLANPFETSLGFALLVLVVEGITLNDATPRQMSQYLQASNAGIQGVSPGNETVEFLGAKRRQLKLLNAALLASLSLAARAVDATSAALIGLPAGCLSLLLLASTIASGGRQVEALTRAPAVERLVEREQAAVGQGVPLHFPHPESSWC